SPEMVRVWPALSVRFPEVNEAEKTGFTKLKPDSAPTLNCVLVVSTDVTVAVLPFVSVRLPVMPPDMEMEIEESVPRAGSNWGQRIPALKNSVGPETLPQLTTSVVAEAIPQRAAHATTTHSDRARAFMTITILAARLSRVCYGHAQP